MNFDTTIGNQTPRAGSEFRINSDRFFHVMNHGWYIHTREGICGPFVLREAADEFLFSHVREKQPDTSESWRS